MVYITKLYYYIEKDDIIIMNKHTHSVVMNNKYRRKKMRCFPSNRLCMYCIETFIHTFRSPFSYKTLRRMHI